VAAPNLAQVCSKVLRLSVLVLNLSASMILKIEQTSEDYKAFNYYYNWTSPNKKESRIINSISPLLAFILLILLRNGYHIENYGVAEIVLLSIGVLLIFTMKYIAKWYSNLHANRIINSGKNADMIGHREIRFENERLVATTSSSHTEILWKAFEKVSETKEHFFLFIAVNQSIIVPKRSFETQAEVETFKKFITNKIQ
jgi:hypothetical protein